MEDIYFDSAATSLKPESVIEAEAYYNREIVVNVNRGTAIKNYEATNLIEGIRERIKSFLNAESSREIIFTTNCSSGINLVANSYIRERVTPESNIVITDLEHHSNYVPWIELAREMNIECRIAKLKDYRLDYDNLEGLIDNNTLITAVTGMSNLTGEAIDIKKISKTAKKNNSKLLIDGAQLINHRTIDLKDLDIDFLTFSAHKIFGPFGLGILYGKEELLKKFKPLEYGGNMVSYIDKNGEIFYKDLPHKLEVGTRNHAAIYAFNKSLDYIKKYPVDFREGITDELSTYLIRGLKEIGGITVYSVPGPIISFNINGIHPHDASDFFDRNGIVLRVGNLCASPFFKNLKESGVIRVSLSFLNKKSEIDKLINTIREIKEFFL